MTNKERAIELVKQFQSCINNNVSINAVVMACLMEISEWKDKQYQELLEKSIEWFNDIAELCSKLTSGNVSHLSATIRGKAIRAAEFIEKHKND